MGCSLLVLLRETKSTLDSKLTIHVSGRHYIRRQIRWRAILYIRINLPAIRSLPPQYILRTESWEKSLNRLLKLVRFFGCKFRPSCWMPLCDNHCSSNTAVDVTKLEPALLDLPCDRILGLAIRGFPRQSCLNSAKPDMPPLNSTEYISDIINREFFFSSSMVSMQMEALRFESYWENLASSHR